MYGIDLQNRQGLEEEKFSKDDWCDLLSISHRYECERARERSIKEIDRSEEHTSELQSLV